MKIKRTHLLFGITLALCSNLSTTNLGAQALGKQYISFSSNRTGKWDIYVIDTNGKNLRRLTDDPVAAYYATWSPNGRAFAYVSFQHEKGEIYVMDLNKNETRRLTNHPASDNYPAWSPDGQWIAFSSNREGNAKGNFDLYKIDATGGNLQRLTNKGKYNSAPAWSPDGKQIAFYSIRNDSGDIYVMDVNRGNPVRLAFGSSPSWSLDGEKIAYYAWEWGGGESIYVMDTKGRNNRRISPLETWSKNPMWSPDGRWIAYELELENPWGNPNRDSNINLIAPNRVGEPRQITEHQAMDKFPAWVPPGFLAVSPTENTQTTLWGTLKQPPHIVK